MSGPKVAQRPFWLGKTALASFLIIFIACAASLVALDRVIAFRNGLPLTVSSSSYSWTYGPTAILIVILSLWRRVDYYYKLREPWRELLAGPSPVDKSLLLDYITTFQVVSIFHAFKRRHFAVATSIAAFFLLKFIILISTTLFVVREINSDGVSNVTMQDAFDTAKAWSMYQEYSVTEAEPDDQLFSGGSDSSIWTYLSGLNNVTNVEVNWRLPEDLVTQRFAFTAGTSNVTRLERPVDIFVHKISCEDATLSELESSKYHSPSLRNYIFTSKTCANGGIWVQPCNGPRYGDTPTPKDTFSPCVRDPRVYSSWRVNCSHGLERADYDWSVPGATHQDMELFDIRYAISAADFEATVKEYPDTRESANVTSMKLIRSWSLICKIGYGIATTNATLDLLTGNVSIPTTALDGALVVDERVPTIRPLGSNSGNTPGASDVLFQLIYAQLGRPDNLDSFYKTSRLKNATISVLEGVAREFARQTLLVPKPVDKLAKAWVTENRLHTRNVALWIMVAGFCVLAFMCLLLLLRSDHFGWIPAMSGSLAGSAAVLVKSPKLQAVISGSGHLTLKEFKAKLDGIKFFAIRGSTGNYEVQADSSFESRSQASSLKGEEKKHAWVPLSVHLPVILATFAAPIIAIGVLELLYHILRDEGHFVQINEDTATLSYIIRISSTLVVFGIATMINNLDSTIVVFAPYSNLRSGSAPADRSILFHLLSVNPFPVMFKSLQHRQFGPALSNSATLIAGFLTIIVSGLWTPANSLISNHPSVAVVNNWDSTWFFNATYDGGAASALNLIRFGGAKTPTGIWKNVVVPEVSLTPDSALRCVGSSTIVELYHNPTRCHINQEHELSCIGWGIDRRCSNSTINGFANLTFGMELLTMDPKWIGKYFDLHQSTAGQVSADCPSIGMIFGSVTRNITIERDLTAVVCSQGIRQVPMRVTYNGNPTLGKIDSMHTHGGSKGVQNGTSKAYTLGYKLEGFLDANLFSFPSNLSSDLYDSFFNHLLLRPKGYSRDDLSGRKNEDKFVQAVTLDYNEYLRHVINRNFRAGKHSLDVNLLSATKDRSVGSLSVHSMITGEFSAEVTHLIVDKTSKLILQVLLATMTFLSFIGFCLVKIKGTLPRDPCSIGSTMALLADSQICDPKSGIIPEAGQQMSENQLRSVFDGWVFSLGWWGSGSSVAPSLAPEDIQNSDTSRKLNSDTAIIEMQSEKRFGVDVGKANGWS
ncbi:hypothetical protein DER45DRAFT_633284 [Fusarium avenaceum]|nr:hypothetical protein DER45DRAFT_633284 [Fusarium avenaceum]